MAFGTPRGSFTNQATSLTANVPLSATGSISVSVGDIVVVLAAVRGTGFPAITFGATLTGGGGLAPVIVGFQPLAAANLNNASWQATYARVNAAGTLTVVDATVATTTNADIAMIATVFEGPFADPPLDLNIAAAADAASPFDCPASGVLAQANELIVGFFAAANSLGTGVTATPSSGATMVPNGQASSAIGANSISGHMNYKVVASTASTFTSFTNAANPSSAGSVGTVTFMQGPFSLTAASFATSNAVLDTPTLAQVSVLTANSLTTSNVSFSPLNLQIVYSFSANALTTSSVVFTAPTATWSYAFSANALTTSNVAFGFVTLGQKHSLAASALTTSNAVFASPTQTQKHALTASALSTTNVVFGSAAIAQKHTLTVSALTTSTVAFGAPSVSQLYALVANALATSNIVFTAPTMDRQIGGLSPLVQRGDVGEKVTLFRLDTTSIGGDVKYFCQAALENSGVSFGGVYYTPVDVEFTGFETTGVGGLPTPHMKLANTNGVFQAIINTYGDLIGCQVQRVRTFKRFLDGQIEADPTAFFGPDTFRVERKVSENPHFIEWELSASFDQEGKMLPGRTVVRDTCLWRYRAWTGSAFDYSKAQCPYTGATYYNAAGQTQTDPAKDVCGRRLSDCKKRFGQSAVLPFGGFPGTARTRSL